MHCRPECDIRENFDTNECPNIFVSTKLHKWISEYIHTNFFDTNECPNKYSYWKWHEYSNVFEYSSRFYTLTHSPTNVRIYSYKQIWPERMSEYIRKRKIDTNECPNIYSWPIYSNIRIYSSHSVVLRLDFHVCTFWSLVSNCTVTVSHCCIKKSIFSKIGSQKYSESKQAFLIREQSLWPLAIKRFKKFGLCCTGMTECTLVSVRWESTLTIRSHY